MYKHKNLILFFLIGFSFNLCNAQINNYTRENFYLPAKIHQKKFKNFPPGTIHLKDNFFIDIKPVNNLEYLEFLYVVSYFWNEKVSEEINKLPDFGLNMNLIKNKFDSIPINSDFVKRLTLNPNLKINGKSDSDEVLRHPNYSYYPIVNINIEQAKMFCQWKSDIISIRHAYSSKDSLERKKYPKKLIYRLPTNIELQQAIKKFGYSKKKKSKDKLVPFVPYPSIHKRRFKKAYFLKSNVSELTLDTIPFGNNWKNSNKLELPNDYTGFRCICEVIKN